MHPRQASFFEPLTAGQRRHAPFRDQGEGEVGGGGGGRGRASARARARLREEGVSEAEVTFSMLPCCLHRLQSGDTPDPSVVKRAAGRGSARGRGISAVADYAKSRTPASFKECGLRVGSVMLFKPASWRPLPCCLRPPPCGLVCAAQRRAGLGRSGRGWKRDFQPF